MLRLVRLELLLNRKVLLSTLAILSAVFVYFANQSDTANQFIGFVSLVTGLSIPVTLEGREDRFRTSVLLCSLPARRSDVVLAKYTMTWAIMTCTLVYALLIAALPFSKVALAHVINPKGLLLLVFFLSFFFAFQLPLTTRFGFKGIMIGLVGLQVLGVLGFVFVDLFGGKRNPLRVVFLAVEKFFRYIVRLEPTAGNLLLLGAAVLVLNAGSFLAARALYVRRDL
jgi:ABC-2 family transporter protein